MLHTAQPRMGIYAGQAKHSKTCSTSTCAEARTVCRQDQTTYQASLGNSRQYSYCQHMLEVFAINNTNLQWWTVAAASAKSRELWATAAAASSRPFLPATTPQLVLDGVGSSSLPTTWQWRPLPCRERRTEHERRCLQQQQAEAHTPHCSAARHGHHVSSISPSPTTASLLAPRICALCELDGVQVTTDAEHEQQPNRERAVSAVGCVVGCAAPTD